MLINILRKIIYRINSLMEEERIKELRKKINKIGKNVNILQNPTIIYPENLIMADNIHIGENAYINALGGLTIEENVIIAPKITIYTVNHRYENATMLPYDGDCLLKSVKIEKNVCIASNVMVCPGVTIGEGSVIAMGSVVTKDVPKFSIAGGNPAKVIKNRDIENYKILDQTGMHYLKLKNENKIKIKNIQFNNNESPIAQ